MPLYHKNFKIVSGVTRIVILTKNYAIKIPNFSEWRLFLLGLLANMQEHIFSELGWPELCPVLFYIAGGWLVVMPKATELSDDEFNNINVEKFCDKKEQGFIPAEYKSDSFGWLNGKVVVIDYGN